MRRLLVLLIIALLPLRGWAGDLMSVRMAVSHVAEVATSAMPADCPMKGMGADHPSELATNTHPATGSNCDSCELCLPFVQWPTLALEAMPFVPHAQPTAGTWAFISAPLALGFKPPIF